MSNLHLLIVHFPIVFAAMYGLVEIISFFKKEPSTFLHQAGGWISLFGTASILIAQQTGEIIQHSSQWSTQQHQLIRVHSTFADALLFIFIVALLGYATDWTLANKDMFRRYFANKPTLSKLFEIKVSVLTKIQPFLCSKWLRLLLGIGSIIAVSIIGALGGAVAFGCGVDPLAQYLCTFF